MANTPKVMLDANNGNNLTVLPLEQIMAKKATSKTEGAPDATPVSVQMGVQTQVQPTTTEPVRQGRFN